MAVRCFADISLPVPIVAPAMFRRPSLIFNSSSHQCLRKLQRSLQPQAAQLLYQPMKLHARLMAAVESGKELVPRSVPVRVAHELLQAGHRYLDVRTVDEFSTGHPVGATNIPYMFKVGSGMSKWEMVTHGSYRSYICWVYWCHRHCGWLFSMGTK